MAQTSTTTYKISFKKIARAAAAEVRVHKKIAIISYVLFGVAFLLFIFDSGGYVGENNTIEYFSASGWGVGFAVAGMCIGYFAVLNIFRDMSNQQFCDVSMALPMKSSERFLSKLLSLFYIQTAPLVVSIIGGQFINLLICLFQCSGAEPLVFEEIFKLFFGAFAGSMFIMAITVFSTCCCGAFAESAYFSVILMGIINILPYSYIYTIIAPSAGLNRYRLDDLIDVGYWGFLYLQNPGDELILRCAVGSAISLAVMLLSGLIYVRRDARSVGTPIASRVFFEIIMFAGCATVFSMSFMNSAVGWGLLIAGVIYIIINIIVSRAKINVLSFLKWTGKFAATTLIFILFGVISIKTYGFGLVNISPDTKYLDNTYITISYWQDNDQYPGNEKYVYKANNLSAEQAERVIDIYKKHFKNSRSKDNPFDLLFGNVSDLTDVIIDIDNTNPIFTKPSPDYFFRYSYNYNDYDPPAEPQIFYTLEYRDELIMSPSDLSAMIDELTQQGLVYCSKGNDASAGVDTEIL